MKNTSPPGKFPPPENSILAEPLPPRIIVVY